MKDSFILYTEQKAVIDKLTNEQAGKLIKAIYEYVATDQMPLLDNLLDLVITPIKTALDKNKEKYEEVSKIRAEAGSKGGKQKVAKQANASKSKQSLANDSKCYDNDNEYVNENENDNENVNAEGEWSDSCADGSQQSDSCVDEIVQFYNENIGAITPHEYEVLNDYRNTFSDDIILYALKLQVEARATGVSYTKAILNNWQKKNVKTLLDAQNENKKRKPKEDDKPPSNVYHNAQYGVLSKYYANL